MEELGSRGHLEGMALGMELSRAEPIALFHGPF